MTCESYQRLHLFLLTVVAHLNCLPVASAAVLWMDQAQRLQEVSATLLDTVPVALPLAPALCLGVRTNISFLPVANPRVGSKMESLPSSPVQTIPTAYASTGLMLGTSESVAAEGWIGVLPAGLEKMIGMKASLMQMQGGMRLELSSSRMTPARFFAGAGMARTKSAVEGTISSSSGKDSFTAESALTFVSAGVQHQRSGVWGSLMIGRKRTTSRLSIVEDQTDLEIVDSLANARQPVWTQVSLGFNFSQTLSFALSELMVPDRIEMPRLTLMWSFLSPSSALRE
jgi:hypothetical protein